MVLFDRSTDQALASVGAMRQEVIWGAVLATLLALIASGLVAGRLASRIARLEEGVTHLREPGQHDPVDVGGRDELTSLANHVNEASLALEEARTHVVNNTRPNSRHGTQRWLARCGSGSRPRPTSAWPWSKPRPPPRPRATSSPT